MSNPFDIFESSTPSKPQSRLNLHSSRASSSSVSSFEYSDSEELRDTIIKSDFEGDFSMISNISSASKHLKLRRSSLSMQENLSSMEAALSTFRSSIDSIKEKIRLRNSELTNISSSIQYYSSEVESANLSIRKSKLQQQASLQSLKTRKRNAKSQFLEAELGFYIKLQELASLKDYLKSLKLYQDYENSEKESRLKIMENRKKFASAIRGKLLKNNECNSFYKFLDESLAKKPNVYFQDLIQQFDLKIRLVLLSELKLWSSTRIFQSMKIKIIDDFHSQAEKIRNRTRDRLKETQKNFERSEKVLNDGIENAQKLLQTRASEKPGLDFKVKLMAGHLLTLEDRIKRKRRKHKRCLKKIKRLTSKLADSEIKLARLKSRYFVDCL